MKESKLPYISIIIPTYRRPEPLAACFQSIACLDYPRDRFEVIVVDDGSPAPPETLVADVSEQFDVKLLTQAHAGPATARNTGAAQARGAILAFTDDDCKPAVDWLQKLAARFATVPACVVGGRTHNAIPGNLFSSTSQMLLDYLYAYYNTDPLNARFFASNNMAFSSDHFYEIGGFDTTFPLAAGEDREICSRWRQHDYPMIYAPEVLVWHYHLLTCKNFLNQHFRYGRGAFYFRQACARSGCKGSRVEPLSFYLNLMHTPFKLTKGPRAPLLAALLFLTQCANAAGYFVVLGGRNG
jgi:cellulose synthase/poly-beta-1,6-N-acetylglucosamine synthase-like glycosyltransferase